MTPGSRQRSLYRFAQRRQVRGVFYLPGRADIIGNQTIVIEETNMGARAANILILLAAGIFLASCTYMTLRYEAVVPDDLNINSDCTNLFNAKTRTVEFTQEFRITGWGIACPLTGIFLGGACWAYAALPFASHKGHAVEEGRRRLKRHTGIPPSFSISQCIMDERVVWVGW